MFKTSATLRDELDEANGKIKTLEQVNGEQADEIAALSNELAEARENLSAANDAATAAQNEVEQRDERITELESELSAANEATEAAEKSAGAKAAAEIAAAGHPPLEVEPEAREKTLREQYQALPPGPERKAFRDKHEAELAKG